MVNDLLNTMKDIDTSISSSLIFKGFILCIGITIIVASIMCQVFDIKTNGN